MTLAAAIDPVELVDKAAAATDRWLFLACVLFIISAAIYIIREQRKSEVAREALESVRVKEQQTFMLTIYTESVKLTAQVLVVLQENNTALKENKISIDHLNTWLDHQIHPQ